MQYEMLSRSNLEGVQGKDFRIDGSERESKQETMILTISETKEGIPTGPTREEITYNLSTTKQLGYNEIPLKDITAQVQTRENVAKSEYGKKKGKWKRRAQNVSFDKETKVGSEMDAGFGTGKNRLWEMN